MAKIEERILTMRFDNAQFKAAAKDTTKVLSDLKGNLKMDGVKSGLEGIGSAATKSLGGINKGVKNVDLSPINNGIEDVKRGMTSLEAISLGVFASIGSAAVTKVFSKIKGSIGMITNPIVTGGMNRARNLEQANFMLGGIVESAEDVELIMKNANNAVTGTAYGLDQAAKAAAQFAASGKRGGQEMENALRGISGVAAMTNSEYDDIASVFTTVAGNGRLMASELNRISARGVNAAAALATSMGITEGEVRELTSKGKIDFDTFAEAMNDAFGEHATKANETYSGSLSNLRAALGRIGADVAVVYLAKMRDLFNELRPAVNAIHKALGPFISMINDRFTKSIDAAIKPIRTFQYALTHFNKFGTSTTSGWTSFFKLMQDIGMVAGLVGDVVRDAFGVIFGQTPRFIEMSDTTTAAGTKIQHIFRKLLSVLMLGPEIIGTILKAIFGLKDSAGDLGSSLLDVVDRFASFLYLSAEMIRKSKVIQKVIGGIGAVIRFVIGILAGLVGGFVKVIDTVSKFVKNFSPLLDFFKQLGTSIKDTWTSLKNFKLPKLNFKNMFNLSSLSEGLRGTFENIKNSMGNLDFSWTSKWKEGLSGIGDWFRNFTMPDFSTMRESLVGAFTDLKATGNLDFVYKIRNIGIGAVDFVKAIDYKGIISGVRNALGGALRKSIEVIKDVGEWIGDALGKVDWASIGTIIAEGIVSAFKFAAKTGAVIVDTVSQFISDIFSKIDWDSVLDGLSNFKDTLGEGIQSAFDSISNFSIDVSPINNAISNLNSAIGNSRIGLSISGIFEEIGGFWSALFGRGRDTNLEAGVIEDVTKTGEGLRTALGFISNPLAETNKAVEKGVSGIGTSFGSGLREAIENVDIVGIFNAAGIATAGVGLFKLSTAIETLAAVPKGVVDVLSGLKTAIDGIAKAVQADIRATAMLKFAIAIGILAGSAIALAFVPWAKMLRGLAFLGLILVAVGALLFGLSKLNLGADAAIAVKLSVLAGVLLTLALSVGILALSMMAFNFVSWESLGKGILLLVSTLGMLALASLAGAGVGMLAMAASIGVLAASIMLMAIALVMINSLNLESLASGLLKLTGMLLVISGFGWAATKFGSIGSLGLQIMALAAGVLILTVALMVLSAIPFETIDQGLMGLVLILTIVGLAAAAFDKLGIAESTAKASKSIILLALAVLILTAAVFVLGSMNAETLIGGVIAAIAIILALAGAMKLMSTVLEKDQSLGDMSAGFMKFALAILVLTAAVFLLAMIEPWSLAKGVGAVAVLVGVLAAAIAGIAFVFGKYGEGIEKAGNGFQKMGIGLLLGAAAMLVLAIAIAVLAAQPWEGVLTGIGALVAGILVLAVAALLLDKVKGSLLTVGAGMLVMSLAVLVLAASLFLLSSIPWQNILAGMLAIAAGVLIMGVAMAVLAPVGVALLIVAGAMLIFAAAIAIVAFSLIALSAVPFEGLVNAATGLAMGLMILGVAAAFLGGFAGPIALFGGALLVIGVALIAVAGAIWIFAEAMEKLSSIGGVFGFLKDQIRGLDDDISAGADKVSESANKAKNIKEEVTPDVSEVANNIDTSQIAEKGGEAGTGFMDMFQAGLSGEGGLDMSSITDQLDISSLAGDINMDEIQGLGAEIPENIGTGIDAGAEGLNGKMPDLMDSIAGGSDALDLSAFKGIGLTATETTAEGIDSSTAVTDETNATISEAASTGASTAAAEMPSVGAAAAQGIAAGLDSNHHIIDAAARSAARKAKTAAESELGIASPSKEFTKIGGFVAEGLAVGIEDNADKPVRAISDTLDQMIDVTDRKTKTLDNSGKTFADGLVDQYMALPSIRRIAELTKHAKALRATEIKDRKIADQEKIEKAEEERKSIYKEVEESKKAIAEAKEETQTAKKETKKTKKSAEEAAKDSAKAAKDAQKQKEKITDAEERHQKALRERDKYEYRMHGEEAGVAFVDGVAVGLMSDEEPIRTLAQIITEIFLEEVDKLKTEVSNYTGIFDGLDSVLKTTKSMGDNVKDLTRAFKRLDSATSPRSIRRNIGIIFESIVGFGGGIQDLIGVISMFEPFLPSLLGSFESSLPAIAAMVAPFAPQLAASLGGGLAAAVPAILVPAMGIIGAIAGIGLFLNDQANGGGLLKTLQKMFKGVIKFIVGIPKRILGVIQTMLKGLKQTIKDLPVILKTLIDGAVDLIVGLVDAIPEVIPTLVEAIVEIMAWVILNAPLLVLEMGTALIMGLARGIDKGIRSLINLLLSPFAWLTGRIGGQLDLFKMAHEAVRGLMNGFAGALASMLLLIISPFVSLWNTIADIFGFNRLAVNSVEDFKNAIVIGMRNAVDAITFPFIALWNFIMGLFGWEQLAYDTASSFIFGTEKGFSDREGAFKSSAERVTWLLTEALHEGTSRNLNDTIKYIDEYMDLVSKGMVQGVSLGSRATRSVADDVWKDIESVFDMAGLGKDELKALTDSFYHGTTNPDTIVSSFGAVFERIEELLSTTETGPQMLTDLNDSLEEGLRQGLLDASMDGIAGLGKSTMAKLTDGMVSEMNLSREDISSAAGSIWKDVEAVFDYYGLGKDGLDDLKAAYEEGTKNPETFASSFQSVFNGVRDELEMVGLGTEVVEGLENSMHTRVRDHLNPTIKKDFKGAKDAIANEMSPINGSSIGEGIVEGIISGILAIPQNILNAGGEVLNTFRTGIEAGFDSLVGLGGILVGWVRDGVGGGLSLISTIGGSVWSKLRDGAESGIDGLKTTGGKLIGWVRDGIGGGFTGMFSSGADALGEFLKGLGGTLGILKDAGVNIIGGVLQGIMSGADWIKNEIIKHGTNAWNAFRSFFGIRSPSRLMAEAGRDIMQGLTMGIRENGDGASEAMLGSGEDILAVTKTIVDEIAAAMALEEDFTITPVIDLSEVRKGVDEIGGLVSAQSMDVDSTMGQVNAIASTMMRDRDGDGPESRTVINNIEFNQTNTSPEPLSAYEIYQNTQRELTLLKLSGTKN